MTEREAWLMMADLWDGAKPNELGTYCVTTGGNEIIAGLCATIPLVAHGKTYKDYIELIRRLQQTLRSEIICTSYYWPLNATGAKARAAFCRHMAEMCEDNAE